jgi:hypothetical protein
MSLRRRMLLAPYAPESVAPPTGGGCTDMRIRANAESNDVFNSNLNGLRGKVQVPSAVTGMATGRASAADLYMSFDDGEFVQGGWYMGGPISNLPQTSSPRTFFGESVPLSESANGEILATPVPVSAGEHEFQLRRSSTGYWYGFIDGVQRWISKYPHWESAKAGAVGETNNTCIQMRSRWYTSGSTATARRTLETRHADNGLWYNWLEHWSYETACAVENALDSGVAGTSVGSSTCN